MAETDDNLYVTFPPSREHSFPAPPTRNLYESEAVLHLSPTRWMLLIFGCVLPEVSGGIVVFKLYPWLSILLFAAALSTLAFIFTYLRRQPCYIRVHPSSIEIQTRRHKTELKRQEINDCLITEPKNVILKHRDEIQVLEVKDPVAFRSAFQKMSS